MNLAQYRLEKCYLKEKDPSLMPIIETDHVENRFKLIAKNPVSVLSIINSTNWPFADSLQTGESLRTKLKNIWKSVPEERLWKISNKERLFIINKIEDTLVKCINREIQDIIQDQVHISKKLEDHLHLEWKRLCRHNRVIGLTADFAAAHRDWLSSLGIYAVIIDEASKILESTLVANILGSSTEHVVLLGDSGKLTESDMLNGNTIDPLNITLFQRWINAGGEKISL